MKLDIKTITDISKNYSNYIKYYLNVSIKTDILCKSLGSIPDDVRNLSDSQILKNYEHFEALCTLIFDMLNDATFCKGTRLFSNVIFMLFKDLIKIYKVYYVHITEVLERFPGLSFEIAQKAFVMY